MSNPRSRLSVFERHLACRRVRELGWSVVAAAFELGLYPTNDARAGARAPFLEDYRSRPHTGLGGHEPRCRFEVNNVRGQHS